MKDEAAGKRTARAVIRAISADSDAPDRFRALWIAEQKGGFEQRLHVVFNDDLLQLHGTVRHRMAEGRRCVCAPLGAGVAARKRARAFVRDAYLAVTALLVLLFVSEMFPSLA